jgi:DNA-binding MarR family transcriptional regulator
VSQKPQFASLPIRAIGDRRLKESHFRLLGAIAYHDRFGKNGAACYASHRKLCERTNLHPVTLSRAAADLEKWGYIESAIGEVDKRQRTYRVAYKKRKLANRLTTRQKSLVRQNDNLLKIRTDHPLKEITLNYL